MRYGKWPSIKTGDLNPAVVIVSNMIDNLGDSYCSGAKRERNLESLTNYEGIQEMVEEIIEDITLPFKVIPE